MTAMPHWPLYLGPNKDLTSSVERVKLMLNLTNNPQAKLNGVVHITGTNGKGSTANYIANILHSHGFSVNLYTSPHIYECNERIVLNGSKISDEDLYFYFEKLREICEINNIEPTLFEATTVVAFMAFAQNNASFNIIEVGMGGKNDATNVFDKSLAVFTSIHVDHARFLGNTPLQNIAQKIDILKPNQKAVSAPQSKDVNDFIKKYGKQNNCDISFFDTDYIVEQIEEKPRKMIFSINDNLMLLDKPGLAGDHQLINASVAIMSVIKLGIEVEAKKINQGIAQTQWPVRMQPITDKCFTDLLPSQSLIFMDGAHNVSGAFIVGNFLKQYKNTHKLYIINGRTKNTDSYGFLQQFVDIVDGVIAVRVTLEALSEAPEIIVEEGLKLGLNIKKGDSILDAVQKISYDCGENKSIVVICGSLYLARDVKYETNKQQ